MNIRFAELTIKFNSAGDVELIQPLECEDLQVITFPVHQAKAIGEAIARMADAKE